MNPMAMISRFALVATLGLICASGAAASVIPVANSSFEILPGGVLPIVYTPPGAFYSVGAGAIPSWSGSNASSGEFQPGTQVGNHTFFTTLSDGITVAFSNGGTLFQTVGPTVVAGVVYTLMVDVGKRNDNASTATVDLLINGHHILAGGIAPTSGNWSTFTANYTGTLADAGHSITIELISRGTQADFDNVRLSNDIATGTPEPTGVSLLGLGLAGLLVFAWRKRATLD